MFQLVSLATLGYVALGVFVPLFVIGLIMLKSLPRAFVLAALGANVAVGHAVGDQARQAMLVAFTSAGAAAGGAIAVWILLKNRSTPPV